MQGSHRDSVVADGYWTLHMRLCSTLLEISRRVLMQMGVIFLVRNSDRHLALDPRQSEGALAMSMTGLFQSSCTLRTLDLL